VWEENAAAREKASKKNRKGQEPWNASKLPKPTAISRRVEELKVAPIKIKVSQKSGRSYKVIDKSNRSRKGIALLDGDGDEDYIVKETPRTKRQNESASPRINSLRL